MNEEKFISDFDFYKSKISVNNEPNTVRKMLMAYCMGYIELSNHLNEELGSFVNVDVVLEKIKVLNV